MWATQGGFTPDALLEFYSSQTAVLASEFPQKSMSYMLIQDGFPQISNDVLTARGWNQRPDDGIDQDWRTGFHRGPAVQGVKRD